MKRRIMIWLSVMLVVGCLSMGRADIPRQINFQGQISNSGGVPLNGVYTCYFRIYDQSAGGNTLYTETTMNLSVSSGLFNYNLGSNGPLNLAFGAAYWLGIQVGTDNELMPRAKIVSVGNAYKALNSDSANIATLAFTASTATTLTSAANIMSGTLADSHLSNNVPLLNNYNTWSNQQIFNGNVGVGMTNNNQSKFQIGQDYLCSLNAYRSLESGHLMTMSASNPLSRLILGYDTSQDCGYINAGRSEQTWTNLLLQSAGGNVGIASAWGGPTEKVDIGDGNLKLRSGNILLSPGYTVDGVDVSQQNATWIGSATAQTLTAATFYDVVTAVNNINGGNTVTWAAPFTQRPTVTTGILVDSYNPRTSFDVQWTYVSNTCGIFRVNYQNIDDLSCGEANSGAVTVMIHAIGK